ncbi:metal-dependent hydrolase (plasmid) [Haladaptatus sp. SPP-AMP-3]|uniref:metal-dependent hydrolase n=1 Tax=Haladaptatus sp. SPP-AMP-3 TaxID=3121295 RepID=UPI003C2ECD0E
MWPWGHLAVGYLCYSLWCRYRNRPPSALGAVTVAVGTQFPDLIDKPLAWTFALLPTGRSLTHSVFTAGLLLAALWVGARRYEKHLPLGAFAIGYLSHLAMDAVKPVMNGNFGDTSFLLWPVLSQPAYSTPKSFLAHFAEFEPTPFVLLQFALAGVALVVWMFDGAPGFEEVRHLWPTTSREHVGER